MTSAKKWEKCDLFVQLVAVPEFVSTGGKSVAAVTAGDAESAITVVISTVALFARETAYVSMVEKSVLVESVGGPASVGMDAERHDVTNVAWTKWLVSHLMWRLVDFLPLPCNDVCEQRSFVSYILNEIKVSPLMLYQ